MTVIENQMSLGLGDLGNDSSQELQGIDALLVGWQLIGLVVVNAFGSVENLRVCWILPSTSRSAVGDSGGLEGKRFVHFVKPALAVRTVEPCRWRAETTRKDACVSLETISNPRSVDARTTARHHCELLRNRLVANRRTVVPMRKSAANWRESASNPAPFRNTARTISM